MVLVQVELAQTTPTASQLVALAQTTIMRLPLVE
jgi:hypothetical protein